jgi:5-methylthioadenosine/S-adenosylhomocysteine deaminase
LYKPVYTATLPMEVVDLLIEARWIVPVDPTGVVLENHAVVVDNGRILAVLPQDEAASRFLAGSHKRGWNSMC